jgi:hypothetical protein
LYTEYKTSFRTLSPDGYGYVWYYKRIVTRISPRPCRNDNLRAEEVVLRI